MAKKKKAQTKRKMSSGARDTPLQPSAALLCKVGSVCIHLFEYTNGDGVADDWIAAKTLLQDPEVKAWLAQMHKLALLPVMRNKKLYTTLR